MRIIEIELHRFKRLAFSAVETIHYRPGEDIQIIIGSNGSGKSSLMSELNPLPPNKNDMLDGGYKKIRIEHKGVEYTLLSKFEKHHKHSFIEHRETGDVELNDGGTGVAQKILIEKVFGLTVELLKLWVGKTRFTDLAPIKRRDWILRFSGSDLNYAMRVFGAFKNEYNDALAIEKHFIKRLAEESADVADKNRIEELEDCVARITGELNRLLEQKDNRVPTVAAIQIEIDRLLQRFDESSKIITRLRITKPSFIPKNIDNEFALGDFITGLEMQVKMLNGQLNEYYDQKDNITKALDTLSANGVQSTSELEVLTDNLRLEIKQLMEITPLFTELASHDINQLMGRYLGCRNLLVETLSTLPDNSDGRYSSEKLNKARAALVNLRARIDSARQRSHELNHHLTIYKDAHEENCPKCNFSFKPGMQQFDMESVERELAKLHESIKVDSDRLKSGEVYVEDAQNYVRQVGGLRRILNDNLELSVLWETLIAEGLYRVHPQSHVPTVMQFEGHLQNCISILKIQEQIRVNETVLASVKEATSGQSNYSENFVNYLDKKIANIIAEIDNVKRMLSVSLSYAKDIKQKCDAWVDVNVIIEDLANKYDLLIRSGINRTVNEIIQTKQIELANVNNALTKITRHDAVVKEIEKQKEVARHNVTNYQILMDALSPVNGLISRYIQSFLDVFIEDINLVISEIWTTDLEILSCGVDSTDVTCKFPLSVNGGFLVTPDIAEASDGQIDIINWAFRMVIAQYLDLQDFPLYLDELAPTLDELHRERLLYYINNLMENRQFEQMFMISHYASNHFAFGNAEVLMLDGRNIINKPGSYNLHAKITYSMDIVPTVNKAA